MVLTKVPAIALLFAAIGSLAPAGEPAQGRAAKAKAAPPLKIVGPETVAVAGPTLAPGTAIRLLYYLPNSVDSHGSASMRGLSGGPVHTSNLNQSRLDITVTVTKPNVAHYLECDIWRYSQDIQKADYEFRVGGLNAPPIKQTLTGNGILKVSFTPTKTGNFTVFLKMTSVGTYMFRKVTLKRAVT